MIVLAACLALAPVSAPVLAPVSAPIPPPGFAQEAPAPALEKKIPRAFPKLKGPARRKAEAALLTLRRGKTDEDLEDAVASLVTIGAGAAPLVLAGWRRFEPDPDAEEEEVDRRPLLEAVLNGVLAEEDLQIAWDEVGKRTPESARVFLLRRWADSGREDAEEFLLERLKKSAGRTAYEAARGLGRRGLKESVPILHAWFMESWAESKSSLRADFQGVERGPLSAACLALVNLEDRAARLAGMRMFELLGSKEHAPALRTHLKNTDPSIKVAAINGLRVTLDGDPPLDKASVLALVEETRKWETRIL